MNSKKYYIVLLFVAISNNVFSQDVASIQTPPPKESVEKFTVDKEQELTDFLVVSCEGKTKEELYKKSIEWINKTFNKPSEVIKAQVENDYIRFQGVSKNEYCYHNLVTMCSDIKYEIEVSVKDGKYKFDVLDLQKGDKDKYGIINWGDAKFKKSWMYFKGNGEVRKMYAETMPKIANYFNILNQSLYDYIYSQNEAAKKNDW